MSHPQVAVVTGASGGIGRWIALGLARAGYLVVLACRRAEAGRETVAWIAGQVPGADIELRVADLSSLEATSGLGEAIAQAHPRLALLVNNAGLFTASRQLTPEGRELVLAVNHLAPYLLTEALQPALLAGSPSRIVNIGSSTSDRARIDPDDLELNRGWNMVRAYGSSKLAMLIATGARAERLRGTGVVAHVVHPGAVATGLVRERGAIGVAWRCMAPFLRSPAQGAAVALQVALAPAWAASTGAYVKDGRAVRPNRLAAEPAVATRRLLQLAP